MPDSNDTLQEICDMNGDPAIIEYINRFRKDFAKYGTDVFFEHKYAFAFGCILMGKFPGGKLLWRPETRLAMFMKDGILYDINGVHEPEGMFYIPTDVIRLETLIDESTAGMEPATQLQVMDAVENWRDYIRTCLRAHRALKEHILTIRELEDFAERFLYVRPDGTSWMEMLYTACIGTKYSRNNPDTKAMAIVLNNLDGNPKNPYFCEISKRIPADEIDLPIVHPVPSKCSIQHVHTGAVRCVMTSALYPTGSVRATIQLTRTPDGFTWEINSWFNEMVDEMGNQPKGEGWGKTCLTVLVQELLEQYGNPCSVAYVWNGQNDYVGNLVTNRWGGICDTPVAVLKNDSVDSWDNHIYTLDTDRFMKWTGLGN